MVTINESWLPFKSYRSWNTGAKIPRRASFAPRPAIKKAKHKNAIHFVRFIFCFLSCLFFALSRSYNPGSGKFRLIELIFFQQLRPAASGSDAALIVIQAENGASCLLKFKVMCFSDSSS